MSDLRGADPTDERVFGSLGSSLGGDIFTRQGRNRAGDTRIVGPRASVAVFRPRWSAL